MLCVDPDADDLADAAAHLEAAGFEVRTADSLAAGEAAVDDAVDCLVTEYDLPDGTGLELIEAVRETTPDVACVLYTDTGMDRIDTIELGDAVAEYQPKGDPDRLVDLVEFSVATRSQTAYPLPEDEDARLAALDRFAADPGALSDSFDRLTRVATELFDVDSSGIGLVDAHSEEFVACYGIELDTLDREDTVCTYTILDDDVTVVADTSADPRFEDNHDLAALGIRFYAGAPLVVDGQRIGSFCLFDDEPRGFDETERALLSDLAALATRELSLRQEIRDLEGETGEAAVEAPGVADPTEGDR